MINIPPIKPRTEIITERLPDVSKTWKIGQLLNATAERGGAATDRVLLRIGQQQLEARTPVAINTGDNVKLLVRALGDTPLLSIQTEATRAEVAAEKLRGVIAQQRDIGQFIRLAQALSGSEQLPTALKNQLRNLLQAVPRADQLSQPGPPRVEALKTAIQNSGAFLESRLLQQADKATGDLKSALLQLSRHIQQNELPALPARNDSAQGSIRGGDVERAIKSFIQGDISMRQLVSTLTTHLTSNELSALQNYLKSNQALLPPTLATALATSLPQIFQYLQQQPNAKQLMDNLFSLLRNLPPIQELKAAVDGSLARITSQQLVPLTRDGEPPLLLMFDLPVKDRDQVHLFRFTVEEDDSSAEQGHGSWKISIHFDMDPLGPIEARLHLIDDRIATVFRAEKQSTVASIQQHLELLEKGFARGGLQVIKLDVIAGRPTQPRPLPEGVHILDEQA